MTANLQYVMKTGAMMEDTGMGLPFQSAVASLRATRRVREGGYCARAVYATMHKLDHPMVHWLDSTQQYCAMQNT